MPHIPWKYNPHELKSGEVQTKNKVQFYVMSETMNLHELSFSWFMPTPYFGELDAKETESDSCLKWEETCIDTIYEPWQKEGLVLTESDLSLDQRQSEFSMSSLNTENWGKVWQGGLDSREDSHSRQRKRDLEREEDSLPHQTGREIS